MEKKGVLGWIGFLVFVLIVMGVAGVVLGISMIVRADDQTAAVSMIGTALFFLQATLAFGFALRTMTR
jgi:hypothetical protein